MSFLKEYRGYAGDSREIVSRFSFPATRPATFFVCTSWTAPSDSWAGVAAQTIAVQYGCRRAGKYRPTFFKSSAYSGPRSRHMRQPRKVLSSGVGWSSLALACTKRRADGRSSRLPWVQSGRATAQDGDWRCVVASRDDSKQLTGGPENPHASTVGTISERCRRASVNNSVNVTTGLQARCHPLSVARQVGYARAWNAIGVFRTT